MFDAMGGLIGGRGSLPHLARPESHAQQGSSGRKDHFGAPRLGAGGFKWCRFRAQHGQRLTASVLAAHQRNYVQDPSLALSRLPREGELQSRIADAVVEKSNADVTESTCSDLPAMSEVFDGSATRCPQLWRSPPSGVDAAGKSNTCAELPAIVKEPVLIIPSQHTQSNTYHALPGLGEPSDSDTDDESDEDAISVLSLRVHINGKPRWERWD